MTQYQAIDKYLNDYGSITPIEAFRDLGITKLATRISEMRRAGYKVKIDRVRSENRYGKVIYYSKYTKENTDDGRKKDVC